MTMTRWRVATASTLIALALIAGAAGADVDLSFGLPQRGLRLELAATS